MSLGSERQGKGGLPGLVHKGGKQGHVHATFGNSTSRGARKQARGHMANQKCLKTREGSSGRLRSPLYLRQRSACRHERNTTFPETECGKVYHKFFAFYNCGQSIA